MSSPKPRSRGVTCQHSQACKTARNWNPASIPGSSWQFSVLLADSCQQPLTGNSTEICSDTNWHKFFSCSDTAGFNLNNTWLIGTNSTFACHSHMQTYTLQMHKPVNSAAARLYMMCGRTVSNCGNTTNLIKHLRFIHNMDDDEVMMWWSEEGAAKASARASMVWPKGQVMTSVILSRNCS